VTYLLDVNVLLGLGFVKHAFNDRMENWLEALETAEFATCAIGAGVFHHPPFLSGHSIQENHSV
jgi:hypothetical protein